MTPPTREQQRAHEYLAEQLRRQLDLRVVPPGRALPPERELMRQFGAGRHTVQRALELLAREGRIERRRGRNGGTFVLDRGEGAPARRLLGELRSQRAVIDEALDLRLELEPAIAALAAERASAAERRSLRGAAARLTKAQDDNEFEQLDTRFHLELAEITHNRFFRDDVERVRLHLNAALAALPASRLWHERSVAEHEEIVAAIQAGEPERAREAMRVHVENTDQSIRALLAAL